MDIMDEKMESFENFIGNVPYVFKTCDMCKHQSEHEVCVTCCWYYDSKFEINPPRNTELTDF